MPIPFHSTVLISIPSYSTFLFVSDSTFLLGEEVGEERESEEKERSKWLCRGVG